MKCKPIKGYGSKRIWEIDDFQNCYEERNGLIGCWARKGKTAVDY